MAPIENQPVSEFTADSQRPEKPADGEYYKPDESARRELAQRWIKQARTGEYGSLFDGEDERG